MAASLQTAHTNLVQNESRASQTAFNTFSFCSSHSFDQDHSLPGFRLLGKAVCVFGVVGSWASQVQKAEACFQAEALLGAGCQADVVVAVAGWSIV